jgi:hypothetical protein
MDMRWVDWHEATDLAKYDILLPPKATVSKGFIISLGEVPVPPMLKGEDTDIEIIDRI